MQVLPPKDGLSYFERGENDKTPLAVLNVRLQGEALKTDPDYGKTFNVAVYTDREIWRDGSSGQPKENVSIRLEIPDLLSKGKDLAFNEQQWPKRSALMREVNDYIQGQLGDRYKYSYSNEGLEISPRDGEHFEAKMEGRDHHGTGIPQALHDEVFGDPMVRMRAVSAKISAVLERAKHNPDLLQSDPPASAKLVAAALQALAKDQELWIEHRSGKFKHKDSDFSHSSYAEGYVFSENLEAQYGLSKEELAKGLRQVMADNNLDISVREHRGAFMLEATPASLKKLKDEVLAHVRVEDQPPTSGKHTAQPEVKPGREIREERDRGA